ncbi:hypothetical protein BB560_003159 [Smittium megazygosporum]|uniref:Uncharacterized protein n=1 Tax=Smittium megazygosporum TaxID=133381 RepID=A0A2T9ZCQ7_9FUNG|nr:hypothetical protein BB560_003159 [Smittium megazygosporum]
MNFIPISLIDPPVSRFDRLRMEAKLKAKARDAYKIHLQPYCLICPRKSCKSKLLYLNGANLVFKPKKQDELNVYPLPQKESGSPVLLEIEIPQDLVSVIEDKKRILIEKLKKNDIELDPFLSDEKLDDEKTLSGKEGLKSEFGSSGTADNVNSAQRNSTSGQSKAFSGFYWCVDDVFKFENIGLSKPAAHSLRFLICAECEYGPLGFHLPPTPSENVSQKDKPSLEYLLAINRVGYLRS